MPGAAFLFIYAWDRRGANAEGYENTNSPETGQKGTKRLVERFGDALLCVRYRYDEKRGVRLKTVELVVEEKALKPTLGFQDGDNVPVIVTFTENGLRERLKAAGGRWNPKEKLWHVFYGSIRGNAELEERILKD